MGRVPRTTQSPKTQMSSHGKIPDNNSKAENAIELAPNKSVEFIRYHYLVSINLKNRNIYISTPVSKVSFDECLALQ
jgi:hypothetical protein